MFINVVVLMIGRDVCFDVFEKVVHGSELRALFGQPDQHNIQGLGYLFAFRCYMCTGSVQEQPYGPMAIAAAPGEENSESPADSSSVLSLRCGGRCAG